MVRNEDASATDTEKGTYSDTVLTNWLFDSSRKAGDSAVLEDADKEFQRRLQMVSAGLYRKEQFVMWYFGCDEKKAAEYLPTENGDGGLFGGDA